MRATHSRKCCRCSEGPSVACERKFLAPEGSQDKLTDGLNKLGDKGWELVTVLPGGGGGAIRVNVGGRGGPGGLPAGAGAGMMVPHLTYVFKRPK